MPVDQIDFISKVSQSAAQNQAAPTKATATRPKKLNRRQKVALALAYTDRAGISRAAAYPPLMRLPGLIGLPMKPLHYRSFLGLALFGFVLFTAIFAGTVYACLELEIRPRPVRAILELGPQVFFAGNAGLALVYAGFIKMQALSAGLPRWSDLGRA